jgi:hypothetical protein
MAVKHLYRHVKTDRPAELVAHLSARPASPFISSKRENVGSIRRLQLEYPALHAQPTYMELLRDQDDFEWSQVGHVNPRHMAETAHYVARYLRYVGRLLHFYSIVEKHPAQRLMRLDTLTLGHQTMFSGGDWTMQSIVMQKVQPATTGARRLIELTGVKHYCQQTVDGCLGLTSDLIVTAEQKKHLKSVRIHLSDMDAPPPFIWAFPVSWSSDTESTRITITITALNRDGTASRTVSFRLSRCLCTFESQVYSLVVVKSHARPSTTGRLKGLISPSTRRQQSCAKRVSGRWFRWANKTRFHGDRHRTRQNAWHATGNRAE